MIGEAAGLPFVFMPSESSCIFVDGENLRHTLVELFKPEFDPTDYLPRNADWSGFFDSLVKQAGVGNRLRTYWYVVEHIDFWPWGLKRLYDREPGKVETVLRKDKKYADELSKIPDPAQRTQAAAQKARALVMRERSMKSRFDGWRVFQEGMAGRFDALEFRRAGAISYNLFTEELGKEKAVDVKLATDLLELRDIYGAAIIVSGDQDYVPAVQAVKDSGKVTVNVSFLKRDGLVLPGGARRLNRATDRTIEMAYDEVKKFMGFPAKAVASTSV
jgi:uncharacterized LabA/DUF88 family protein